MSGIMPRNGSSAYKICRLIHRVGKITLKQGIESHQLFGVNLADTVAVYNKALLMNYLCEIDGFYSLMPHVTKHFDDMADIQTVKQVGIAPMYRKPFREMQPVKRDPRLREFHPVTVS